MTDIPLAEEPSNAEVPTFDGDDVRNFPRSHDKDVTFGNPQRPHVPLTSTTVATRGEVTFIGSSSSTGSHGQETAAWEGCIADCHNLSKTELRKRYPREASSHSHMLERVRDLGRVIDPSFRKFVSFLRHVGPMPCKGLTLDRIDNTDPEYAPGKVRWADKRTQNSNKGDTHSFHCAQTGAYISVRRLAALHKVSPSAIRKRVKRGWTHDQVIAGKVSPAHVPAVPVEAAPTRQKETLSPPLDVVWFQAMSATRPGECSTLTSAEKGMLNNLASFFRSASLISWAEDIFQHVLEHWEAYAGLVSKDHGVYKPPMVPTINLLVKHPRAAVNLWLRANKMELRNGVPQQTAPEPRHLLAPNIAAPNLVRRIEWDKRSWEEARLSTFTEIEEALNGFGVKVTRKGHVRQVMIDWRRQRCPMIQDMPQWATDILSEHAPGFAADLRELLARDAEPRPAELMPPLPEHDEKPYMKYGL